MRHVSRSPSVPTTQGVKPSSSHQASLSENAGKGADKDGSGKPSARAAQKKKGKPPHKKKTSSDSAPIPGLAARRAAYDLFHLVIRRNVPLGEALAQCPSFYNLSAQRAPEERQQDRALARMILSSCLRYLGEIDALLAQCLDKPLPQDQKATQDILRIGAAQLLFLRVPSHAAVGLSVELAPRLGAFRFKGLINGVLRRLDREKDALRAKALQKAGLSETPALLALPPWLQARLIKDYGAEKAHQIAQAHLGDPPLDLSIKDPLTLSTWAKTLEGDCLPNGSVRLRHFSGDVSQLAGYDEGAWWVQDSAATLPVRVLDPKEGQSIIDLCAAPGGKTAQIAAKGAHVLSVENARERLARLEENMQRLALPGESLCADGRLWRPEKLYDAVLLDAPCSATGTLRRHPDVAWLKQTESFSEIYDLQEALLANAARMVKPGGSLVYATCSLLKEEGEVRIAHFLSTQKQDAKGSDWSIRSIDPQAIGLEPHFKTEEGFLRSLPCDWSEHGGMDGFFIAHLQRGHS